MPVPIRIISDPGIKRDGTLLEGKNYIDGQWCRFARGLPRKILGYRNVADQATTKIYGLHAFAYSGTEYLHSGSADNILQYKLDFDSVLQQISDRTPSAGFVASADNLWQFATLYDSVSGHTALIAHAGQNLTYIDSTTTTKIFIGDVNAGTALTDTGAAAVSGGIAACAPYLIKFGNDGWVSWSVPNKPTDFTGIGSGEARVTGAKLVRALELRGNGLGPAFLLWSLDSLIRATFTGGAGAFAFDTIGQTSIMGSATVVEYDGIYYWVGIDRFLSFSGVIREIPNQMNMDWFFENVNYQYRQKCFALKNPRWGEIWWCYPRGHATECTHAIIYNIREQSWYDTKLPNSGRSAAAFTTVYEHPFMAGVDLTSDNTYRIWKHEETVFDEIDGHNVRPIESWFETNEISLLEEQQAQDKSLRVVRVEPDFVQQGPMILTVTGRANARATEIISDAFEYPDYQTVPAPDEQTIPLKEVRRLMRFRFYSNTPGGDYRMGHCFAHVEPADGRVND